MTFCEKLGIPRINTSIEKIPRLKKFDIHRDTLQALCVSSFGHEIDTHLWDKKYVFVSRKDWTGIIKDIQTRLPRYEKDVFDCENFAMFFAAEVARKYKLNTCGVVIGDSPMGWHGFNVFAALDERSKVSLYILEPQGGKVYLPFEKSGYAPKILIFG